MEVANAAADRIGARHSTRWSRGNICEVICTHITLLGVSHASQAIALAMSVCPI